jgi:hypothetical protein
MNSVPPPNKRRPLLDGGLAILALTLAVLTGYGILAPPLRATPNPESETPVPAPEPATTGTPEAETQKEKAPEPVEGQVVDADRGFPIAGASVVVGREEVKADTDGRFNLGRRQGSVALIVKAPGYDKRVVVVAEPGRQTIALTPRRVKAAYLSYFGVGEKAVRERVFAALDRTELNGVVIDVKGDRGWIPYPTEVPLAIEAGALGPLRLREFDRLLATLKARGIYTIARIVVFKDNVLAHYQPGWAVLDARTGKPWTDNERLAWVDPFREEVWDYVIAVAREAALKGFDEVQFDYLRFPTDGRLAAARYSQPNTRDSRLRAISAFLARARRELAPTGVFLAADLFGYTAFNDNDTDIGQRIEEIAAHVDYLSPMVYPSGYHLGIPGYRNPVAYPYQIVFESVRLARKRSAFAGVLVRPWLQDFRDYAFDRRPFGVKEVTAQLKGAVDAGASGWMLWNPRNEYTTAALRPKVRFAASGPSP